MLSEKFIFLLEALNVGREKLYVLSWARQIGFRASSLVGPQPPQPTLRVDRQHAEVRTETGRPLECRFGTTAMGPLETCPRTAQG
jgi:hypothetical protein